MLSSPSTYFSLVLFPFLSLLLFFFLARATRTAPLGYNYFRTLFFIFFFFFVHEADQSFLHERLARESGHASFRSSSRAWNQAGVVPSFLRGPFTFLVR